MFCGKLIMYILQKTMGDTTLIHAQISVNLC